MNLTNALAWRADPASISVLVTESDADCSIKSDAFSVRALHFSVVRPLAPDGSEDPVGAMAFYEFGGAGTIRVTLDASPRDALVSGVLDADIRYKEESGGFKARGTFHAKDCGALPPRHVDVDTAQPGVSLRVAGKVFPVLGGILRGGEVVLSAEPLDCAYQDGLHYLELRAKLDRTKFTDFRLQGTALAGDARGDGGEPASELHGFMGTGKIDGDVHWKLDLPKVVDSKQSYRVQVDGALSLENCHD